MGDQWYFNQQCPPSLPPSAPQNQYSYLPTASISAEYQWNPSLDPSWDNQQTYPGLPTPYHEVSRPPYGLTQPHVPSSSVSLHYGYDSSHQFNLPAPYNDPRTGSCQRGPGVSEGVDFKKELEDYKAAKRAKMEAASVSSSQTTNSLSTLISFYKIRSRSSSRRRSRSRDRYRSRSISRNRQRSRSRRRSRSQRSRSRSIRNRPRSRSHNRSRSPCRSKSSLNSISRQRSRSPCRSKSFLNSISRQRSRSRSSTRRQPTSRSSSRSKRFKAGSRERQEATGSFRTSRERRSVEKDSTKTALSERAEILDKWKKNYCNTEVKINKKLEEYSKKTEDILESEQGIWTRSTPAELYYTRDHTNFKICKGTQKLTDLASTFKDALVDRTAKVNALKPPYVPPPRRTRTGLCKHKSEISSSSDSDNSDATLSDEEDFSMEELQRKQQHPDRLDPEMWYNDPGEMNDGPLCRCSHKSRKSGIRHEIYPGETPIPKCDIYSNNGGKLYYYRIIISPPTNFLIKAPTIIHHDEHEFIFEGFSILSHAPLAKLPPCKVIRFNIEYTILYYEEKIPENFTISELDLFVTFLFREVLELVDLELTTPLDSAHCSQFHFMPRFVRELPDNGKEILCMQQVLQYLLDSSVPLIQRGDLENMVNMSQYEWQNFADELKGMVVTYPGKKPSSVRVDQLDRNIDLQKAGDYKFPEIVHFGIRPPQLSYAGNPDYQKAWREYVKFRHLIANMSKPTFDDKRKLEAKENKLQEMRTQGQMKRDVTVAVSAEGFFRTGIMCDIVQHAMLIPVLVCHLRFHNSLNVLEDSVAYKFKNRGLLQLALTHPSYRENFGTNPDHARNSLTNCGIRQPEYGDRRIHYMNTRKRGINTLINIMSRFGKQEETESNITHNERLEFLGDAVVEFLSSIHLFFSFPHLEEGGLATYRAAIVQNQHLALLARVLKLDQFMLYAHGSDLCHDLELKHAMANCFEALMGALFLDGGIDVADRVFSNTLYRDQAELLEVWVQLPPHPLQEQEPLGDRHWIEKFEILKKLTDFEKSINVEFNHIRLLARAFTDRSVGYTNLTMGSNQRLEFLGDTVLQLIASEYLYRFFPEHHEGHLSLLRSSLVNNRTQAVVCDDLGMSQYALYNNPKPELKTKDRADLLEAFIGALYVDQGMEYCELFCQVTLFPRLQDFIMNQDWNDPKSKLQQCCLTLRTMDGGEPDIPVYKVIECKGPTNTRVYTVAVYFRNRRLASAMGHSIQQAEMNAAKKALEISHDLFPQLDHQKRVIAKSMKKQKRSKYHRATAFERDTKSPESYSRNRFRSKSPTVGRRSQSRYRGYDSDDSRSSKGSQSSISVPSSSLPKSYRIGERDFKNKPKEVLRLSSSTSSRRKSSFKRSRRTRSEDDNSDCQLISMSRPPDRKEKGRRIHSRSKTPSGKEYIRPRHSRSKTPSTKEPNKYRHSKSKTPSVKEQSRHRLSRSKTPNVKKQSKRRRSRSKTPSVKEQSRHRRSRSKTPIVRQQSKHRHSRSQTPSVKEQSKPRRSRSKIPSVKEQSRHRRSRSKTPIVKEQSKHRHSRSQTPSVKEQSKPRRNRSKIPSVKEQSRHRRSRSKTPIVKEQSKHRHSRSQTPSVKEQSKPRRSRSKIPSVKEQSRHRRSRSKTPIVKEQSKHRHSRSQTPSVKEQSKPRRSRSKIPSVKELSRHRRSRSKTPIVRQQSKHRHSRSQTSIVKEKIRDKHNRSRTPTVKKQSSKNAREASNKGDRSTTSDELNSSTESIKGGCEKQVSSNTAAEKAGGCDKKTETDKILSSRDK